MNNFLDSYFYPILEAADKGELWNIIKEMFIMNLEEVLKRVLNAGAVVMEPDLVEEVLEAKMQAKKERKDYEELKEYYVELSKSYSDLLVENMKLREEIENIHKLLEY